MFHLKEYQLYFSRLCISRPCNESLVNDLKLKFYRKLREETLDFLLFLLNTHSIFLRFNPRKIKWKT